MDKLSEKAKFIDIYASRPVLSFGKDGKVYSSLGLILTFLTVVIIGGMAIWIGINIFGRQRPSFVQYNLPPKVLNPIIPWNTDDFKFGVKLDDENEDVYVRIYPDYFNGVNSISMGMNSECHFDIAPGQNFKCFYQMEDKDKTYLDAKGTWEYIVKFKSCYWNNEEGDGCSNYNNSIKHLKDKVTGTVVYDDLLIDPFNYENPITMTTSYTTALVLLDIGTALVIELNEVEFTSDNGWIFQDLKTETKLKPTTSLKVSGDEFLKVQVVYGGAKTVYKRTYPKIQDFFAQVSGFITIITPIFLLLVSPYGDLQAVQHMTNEIYEIKLNKPSPKNGRSSPQKISSKKKKKSSKSQAPPITARGTEGNLLPKGANVKSKSSVQTTSPPANQKSIPFVPHAALVIGGAGKLPTKDDTPPIPEENIAPFSFESLERSPSSPFKLGSITSRHEESNLISPRKSLFDSTKTCPPKSEDGKLNENLQPVEAKQQIDSESEEEVEVPLRTSDPLEVPWQTWLMSFWKPNPEVQVLNKAKEHIMDNFDLVTLSKKIIEIDKLKACLLTHEQRVLFENLPSSVIVLNPEIDINSPEAIKQYHWKDSFKGDEVALRKAYSKLQGTKNQLDQLLIRLYESEYIYDGFRQKDE